MAVVLDPLGDVAISALVTDKLAVEFEGFHAGGGVKKDIDNINYLAQNMLGRTFCPLGDAAAIPTMSIVQKWRQEFEDHLEGKPCPFESKKQIPEPAFA